MPFAKKLFLILTGLSLLPGCTAVAVGGAVIGTTATVVGTTVKATTSVAGAAVGLAIPDGDDDEVRP